MVKFVRSGPFLGSILALGFLLLPYVGGSAERVPFDCQTWESAAPLRAAAGDDEWTIGKKRLLFYRVRFSDTVENEPISFEEAETTLTEANRRFVKMSYGQFSLDWTITSLLQLEHEIAHYRDAGFAGLLFDVRNAASVAGYHSEEFDLDLIFSPQIPSFPAGQANIRQKGALVHQNYAATFVHELGHNLGLFHANLWDNSRASIQFHSTPPFPSNISEYGENIAFDPASLMGNGDLRSPGHSVEYGDFFDPMGGSAGDFNPAFKARLKWLAPAQVERVDTNGIYRLYAYDQGTAQADLNYALRISRLIDGRGQNYTFRYWVSFRTRIPEDISVPLGAQLHWIDQSESYTSQLLDLQPGSPLLAWDSALPLGRTFSDSEAGIHITPRASGSDALGSWMEVQINLDSPKNEVPLFLSLQPQDVVLQPEEQIELKATATDPEGNDLTFYWNLGDGTFNGGSNRVAKTWSKPGQYLVRCEVSDGKGRKTARQILVKVGDISSFFIQGRVVGVDGSPVSGALVTNGKIAPEAGMLPDYSVTESDSSGVYILPRLAPGIYDVGVQAYGWVISRLNREGPVRIDSENVSSLDFVATALPTVTVTSVGSVKEGESIPITFRRSGDLDDNLVLDFVANGTAGPGQDYRPFSSQRVTIPKGSESLTLVFEALEDLDEDADEEVFFTVIPPNETLRSIPSREDSREVTFFYPGWEPHATSVGELWFQTSPTFQRGPGSTTSVRIVDTTPKGIQRISILNQSGIAYERPRAVVPVRITRIGSTASPLEVHFSVGGTAENGIDYDFIAPVATIPVGSDFVEVNISPISDVSLEGDETVELQLLSSDQYRIDGNSVVQLTIQEDEFHSSPNHVQFGFRWGGGIVIQLSGESGKTYFLETSKDLLDWSSVSTNTIDFSPIGIPIPPFSDALRFYRSREDR